MYKLIIVDDEQKTVNMLSHSIDWQSYGFTVSKTFCDAASAYDYVVSDTVDLVICDIYMPVMSGIDFLKQLSELANPPLFIVLSAFREFEYAQEALRHGAFDYITKPVTEEKFSVALSRAKATLDKSGAQPERNLSVKHMLVERVLSKTLYDQSTIKSMLAKSDLQLSAAQAPAVIIRASVADFQKYCEDNAEIYSPQQFQNSIYNLFEMVHPNVVVYNYSYNFIYFAVIAPSCNYGEFITLIKEKLDEISNTALEILNTEFVFDVYNIMADVFGLCGDTLELTANSTAAIADAIINKKHSSLNELCFSFIKKHSNSPEVNRFMYFVLLLLLDTKLGISFEIFNTQNELSCNNTEKLSRSITKLIDLCVIKSSDAEVKESSHIVEKAQKFIQDNFKENIKMTIIAKEVHVSVSYLSRLFKQETGQSIVHYIKNIRLKYAKELLLTTEDSIESIAFNSGYRSRNLFNSDFKEKYGHSPRSFKNNMTKEMEKFET